MLNVREYRRRPSRLADFLPWAALVAPGVVLNKDGSLQRTIRYRGPDLESVTPEELVSFTARVNNVLRRFGSGWALFFEASRIPARDYPASAWRSPAALLVDEERRATFEAAGRHFESEHFLTLAFLPPSDRARSTEAFFLHRESGPAAGYRDHLDRFVRESDRAVDLLSVLMPEIDPLGDEETLSYLHSTISTKRHQVRAPETPMYLDALLVDSALTGGLEPMLGDEHLRCLAILGFPPASEPGLLDALNSLGFAYRWATRFIALDKSEAARELAKYRRQWFAKRKSVAAILKEALFNEPSVLVDADAENKAADADAALEALGADDVAFGYLTTTLVVADKDRAAVDAKVRDIERILNGRGFVTIRETVNAVEAFLGGLPGHLYANIRQPLLHTLNLAHLAPLSAVWAGQQANRTLDGPPLLCATTQETTPFRLSTHIGDVGHAFIVGPTGAGKSTLLALMAMQFSRYRRSQIFAFDKGKSMRAAILALGGAYHDLDAEDGLSFQPLASIDDDAGLARACAWLVGVLAGEGAALDPAQKNALFDALQNLASAPRRERTLTGVSLLLDRSDLRGALRPFTLDGPFGALFDADADALDLNDAQVFEMEGLMRRAGAVAPALSYLLDRLEERFDGRPSLLILDEAWVFLDHPLFAKRLKDWLKTLRKKNVSVIFATQSLSDIQSSAIASAIIESCPSRIFLPNARAMEGQIRPAYEAFGLNSRQIEIISAATPKRDYYYQSPIGNRLFDLDMGPVALSFCGANSPDDHALIDRIVARGGASSFAPAFLAAKGLAWAGDLIDHAALEEKCANGQ